MLSDNVGPLDGHVRKILILRQFWGNSVFLEVIITKITTCQRRCLKLAAKPVALSG